MDTSRGLSLKNSSSFEQSSAPQSLVFDTRYGWVIDVWKDPSEEALSGGRGMFCIVPLAKALVKAASETDNWGRYFLPMITVAASSAKKVLEKPELFSPEMLQANLNDQMKRITSSMKKPEFDLAVVTRRWEFSSNSNEERSELNKC